MLRSIVLAVAERILRVCRLSDDEHYPIYLNATISWIAETLYVHWPWGEMHMGEKLPERECILLSCGVTEMVVPGFDALKNCSSESAYKYSITQQIERIKSNGESHQGDMRYVQKCTHWRKWKKWQLIAKIAKLKTKIQMRWQRGPLPSGDFSENGVFGENGRNGA